MGVKYAIVLESPYALAVQAAEDIRIIGSKYPVLKTERNTVKLLINTPAYSGGYIFYNNEVCFVNEEIFTDKEYEELWV